MKKLFFLSVTILAAAVANAQPGKTVTVAKTNTHIKAFNVAASSGDLSTAITTLNYYIAEQGDNTPYADTLAMMYMQQGEYAQCYFWADKRLKVKPEDNGLLEMKGMCLDKLQEPKLAIDVFEKLFARTKSPYHGYKLMELQYKPEYTMTYNVGEQVGRTYLQAGVYNIHALALYDLDKKAEAKNYFAKALALDSNFVLARQNLEAMKSIESNPNKINNSNAVPTAPPANKQN
jgi:tetratricopeptide (TPR) repeat protein